VDSRSLSATVVTARGWTTEGTRCEEKAWRDCDSTYLRWPGQLTSAFRCCNRHSVSVDFRLQSFVFRVINYWWTLLYTFNY